MAYRFLVDECLSPALVRLAVDAGHAGSTCVRDRGWSGTKDWQLVAFAIAGDYTLVTHNAVDFRGRRDDVPRGHYAAQELHAGLVCLNSALPMSISRQLRLFGQVLSQMDLRPDLINSAMEIFEDQDGNTIIEVYDIPRPVD